MSTHDRRSMPLHFCQAGVAALLGYLGAAPTAYSQQAVAQFSVPAQPLGAALLQLGQQAHVSISVPQDLVAGKTSAAVDGAMSVRAALSRLLSASGLSFEFVNPDAVRIVSATAPPSMTSCRTPSGSTPPRPCWRP